MSTADLSDQQLGTEALRGDREAFAALFSRHESGLFNVAYRLTGSREDAADITQESFLRVFARLDDLAGREVNLAAYLHRTARNLVYDRSAQRAREAPTGEVERVAGADEAMEADPELTTLVAAQGADVRAANERLPERHRLALALRELEGMSYDDIGRVLDITAGAVAQLLVRARLALRRELRLGAVDVAAMDASCRSRLGDIGALIDGELNADRAHVLTQHLALCAACREARASFEDARVTYRAWLPLPVLALGASTARAAEGRGLVRFAGGGRRGAAHWRGSGAGGSGVGGFLGGGRKAVAKVGAGLVGLLILFGAPTLVAVRSGSTAPPAGPASAGAPAVATEPGTTAATPGVTAATATVVAPAGEAPGPTGAALTTTTTSPPSAGVPPTTRARAPRAPADPATTGSPPPATNAGGAVTAAQPATTGTPTVSEPPRTTVVPPTTTAQDPPPTTTREPPPTTTSEPPPTRTDPPVTTRPPPRDDPPVF